MKYCFFRDDEIYKNSKYTLMITYNENHPFPRPVFIESIEKDKWEWPVMGDDGLLKTPPCGNPKVKYFTEQEFHRTFFIPNQF